MNLFPDEMCEYCGRKGRHHACEQAVAESARLYREADAAFLRQYAARYGVHGPSSEQSFSRACAVLAAFLGRDLECEREQAIEGKTWWFLPERWIGIIGFIVEKESERVFMLGSGLASLSQLKNAYSHWHGIDAYLSGKIQAE